MKKQRLILAASIMLFACGSNAENNVTPITEAVEQTEEVIVKEIVEDIAAEEIVKEEIKEANIEQAVLLDEKLEKKEPEPKKEVVKKVVVEEKTLVMEVVKANHDNWNILTKKYVGATGKVNYKGMKSDLSKITAYLDHLKNTPPKNDWSKNEKLAYWINLYNASTVYLIASNYPITSIKNLNGGKPWDKKFVKSGNEVYTLNEIEHNIVRPRFKDPRIHAALNCAAVSCPILLNAAYEPSKLNAQLDKQARAWINDWNKNEITPNKLKLSQIFDWYAVDFKSGGGVIAFISKYNNSKIIISPKAKISYLEYNWGLNE